MKKATSNNVALRQKRELARLAQLADDTIDTRDVPEVRDWSGARRGVFFRPVKQQLTLRLDSDVIAWFRGCAPKGYQTEINRALRKHIDLQKGRVRRAG